MNKEILKEWIELNVDSDLKGESGEYYSKETFIQALQEFNKQTNQEVAPESVGFSFNAAGAKMGLSAEEVAESLKALSDVWDKANVAGGLGIQLNRKTEIKKGDVVKYDNGKYKETFIACSIDDNHIYSTEYNQTSFSKKYCTKVH